MNLPENLRYTKDHVWVLQEGDTVKLGITDYAQEQLGDILFVDLPEVGKAFDKGDYFTEIESSKTASEVAIPLSGEVVAVNEELNDSPENINEDAYASWIIELKTGDSLDGLLQAADYKAGLD